MYCLRNLQNSRTRAELEIHTPQVSLRLLINPKMSANQTWKQHEATALAWRQADDTLNPEMPGLRTTLTISLAYFCISSRFHQGAWLDQCASCSCLHSAHAVRRLQAFALPSPHDLANTSTAGSCSAKLSWPDWFWYECIMCLTTTSTILYYYLLLSLLLHCLQVCQSLGSPILPCHSCKASARFSVQATKCLLRAVLRNLPGPPADKQSQWDPPRNVETSVWREGNLVSMWNSPFLRFPGW